MARAQVTREVEVNVGEGEAMEGEVTIIVEVEREAPMAAPTAVPAQTAAPQQQSDAGRMMSARGSDGAAGAAGTPPDTTFRDYQRQPFVAASEDNVSTFSLDTDRTSFQLALNWARAGYQVNPDSVRAEEWINAFNYEYDPPSGTDGFAIQGGLYPHPLDEDKRLARIGFQAPELVDDKPLNVTLVLDASGSYGRRQPRGHRAAGGGAASARACAPTTISPWSTLPRT